MKDLFFGLTFYIDDKSAGVLTANTRETDSKGEKDGSKAQPDDMVAVTMDSSPSAIEVSQGESQMRVEKTLKDAVKPKHKRKKKVSAAASGN